MRKPKSYKGNQAVGIGGQNKGIFGVSKPVATTLKVAGGSPGYDPFTKSIGLKRGLSSPPSRPVSKKVYVGSGGGASGASSKVSGR
jgi:hypothetical protein